MNSPALRLLQQDTGPHREWLLSLDFDARVNLIRWVLSCGTPDATAEQREFLRLATEGSDPKEKLHDIITAAVAPLPYADKEAILKILRRDAPLLYREIGHWRWLAYDDLASLTDRTTQGWLREAQSDDLEIALKAASQDLYDKIMRNLSKVCGEIIASYVTKAAVPEPEQLAKVQGIIFDTVRKYLREKHAETIGAEAEHDRLLVLAEADDAEAQCTLATMYWYGFGNWLHEDSDIAIRWFKRAAELGSSDGLYGAGLVYRDMDKHEEALQCFLEASARGDSNASLKAGNYYGNDESQFHNPAKAAEYYLKAAEQGSTNVYPRLGAMYAYGVGIEQDDAKAREWFRKGAEAGDSDCQFQYALACDEGLGGEKDLEAARHWYAKAAEQHSPEAAFNLGCLYFSEGALPRDLGEAEKWFLQAAEEGLPIAFHNLGCLNEERGNLPETLKWFMLARELGHEEGSREIEELGEKLAVAEIEKAKASAAGWQMQHGLLFSNAAI